MAGPATGTLTGAAFQRGDVQLLAVVLERNAILRWEKTAVGEGPAGRAGTEAPLPEALPRLDQVHHGHWPGCLRGDPSLPFASGPEQE